MVEHSPNGTLSAPQLPEHLVERIARLELRVREQEEKVRIRETELVATDRETLLESAYVKRLEREQQVLAVELAQVRERAAELFSDLGAVEARLAAESALLAEVRAAPSYRLACRFTRLVRRLGPFAWPARRLVAAMLARRARGR